jgi:hypothetical protein
MGAATYLLHIVLELLKVTSRLRQKLQDLSQCERKVGSFERIVRIKGGVDTRRGHIGEGYILAAQAVGTDDTTQPGGFNLHDRHSHWVSKC